MYEERETWLSRSDFLAKSVADRVRYVRSNLVGRGEDGGMTQPELAAAAGATSHLAVVRWEKGYSEPRKLKKKLADLTPYEPDDFLQRSSAAPSPAWLGARLQELEGEADEVRAMVRGLLLHLKVELVPAADGGDPTFRQVQPQRAQSGSRKR